MLTDQTLSKECILKLVSVLGGRWIVIMRGNFKLYLGNELKEGELVNLIVTPHASEVKLMENISKLEK